MYAPQPDPVVSKETVLNNRMEERRAEPHLHPLLAVGDDGAGDKDRLYQRRRHGVGKSDAYVL